MCHNVLLRDVYHRQVFTNTQPCVLTEIWASLPGHVADAISLIMSLIKASAILKSHPASVAVRPTGEQRCLALHGLGLGLRGLHRSVHKRATYWCKSLYDFKHSSSCSSRSSRGSKIATIVFVLQPQACVLTSQARHQCWKSLTDKHL